MILPPVPDQVEHGQAGVIHRDRFAVQHTGANRQAGDGFHNKREAVHEIIPVARGEPDAIAVAVSDDAKAVVLDFVNPAGARWRLLGRPGQTRIEAPDRALGLMQR
jgi:hypothetical protein